MGLDAFVCCTCFQDGRAAPPPFPSEWIVFDEKEGCFDLLIEGDDEDLPFDDDEELRSRFHDWMASCCEHEDMQIASVRVAGNGGRRDFGNALAGIGWELVPTLLQELPSLNEGATSPAAAARALEELAVFREHTHLLHNWFLVDEDTGHRVWSSNARRGGRFVLSVGSEVAVGFDPQGLFVVTRTEPPRELFRAMRLEQRVSDPSREPRTAELVDLDTGQRLECGFVITEGLLSRRPDRRQPGDYPRRLRFEQQALHPGQFAHTLEQLERIFRVSVETGNPVAWC